MNSTSKVEGIVDMMRRKVKNVKFLDSILEEMIKRQMRGRQAGVFLRSMVNLVRSSECLGRVKSVV